MGIEFGIRLPTLAGIPSFARKAEDLGFDYLMCPEHVLFHGPVPNAFVALAVAAGATQRIKLLSAVTLLPLYPAVLAAKMTSVLDVASGGRFNVGIGVGGEFPLEFNACGVPVAERASRANEALEVMRLLFTNSPASYTGKYTRFINADLQPKPIQKPWPPVWIGGRWRSAMQRAAKYADVWIPYLYTPEALAQSIDLIRQYRVNEAMAPVRSSIHVFVTVYPDAVQAQRVAAELLSTMYRRDFTGTASRYFVAGTPAQCRTRLKEYVAAGASSIQAALLCSEDDMDSMLILMAEQVLPEFRSPRGSQ